MEFMSIDVRLIWLFVVVVVVMRQVDNKIYSSLTKFNLILFWWMSFFKNVQVDQAHHHMLKFQFLFWWMSFFKFIQMGHGSATSIVIVYEGTDFWFEPQSRFRARWKLCLVIEGRSSERGRMRALSGRRFRSLRIFSVKSNLFTNCI